jgi:hypothetical protein
MYSNNCIFLLLPLAINAYAILRFEVEINMRSANKVCKLIVGKVLLVHTALLNISVVTFKVLPLGSYAPMPAPSPPLKTILDY